MKSKATVGPWPAQDDAGSFTILEDKPKQDEKSHMVPECNLIYSRIV